ncbi:MAG: peptidoglycan recognition protein family protein [Acidimicrobiia bacterium]|nr:peptidoglycan recognition protein family protein [Acidimicrobiia bacterium]
MPEYDTVVKKLVVHHTATPNNPPDPASSIRGIYHYHLSGEWIDIAYHWLIDQDGRIYEGRWAADYPAGAVHTGEDAEGRQVRGGHASATNTATIGIALLGTFTSVGPTEATVEALVNLLAWKCARWGIDPLGSDEYVDGRVFPNVCAHRDVTATTCPGDPLVRRMSEIRERVAARIREGRNGYWISTRAGGALAFGDVPDLGDPRRLGIRATIQSIVPNPAGVGYWMLGTDGGVFSFGDAGFYGSTGGMRLNRPVVGMAPTTTGRGYWLVARDGGIFSFGDAGFFGSTGAIRLNQPIVGMAPTPSGNGYWLVAADGGIFSFGDAGFFGSTGAIRLNQPIVGMAPTPSGKGYWLVASDGGIFAFGDAEFFGSTGGIRLVQPIVAMASTPTGQGYWLLARDGGSSPSATPPSTAARRARWAATRWASPPGCWAEPGARSGHRER